jgi:dTDP-4-amino-4,6-dideoxygalactose transaminase
VTPDPATPTPAAGVLPADRVGVPTDATATAPDADPQLPRIPFNHPYATGEELGHIQEAIDNLHLSGNGPFTARCAQWLQEQLGCARALLTGSCTAALEMAMLVAGVGPGDEVIVPSFAFPTTAGAVALRGAVPVFVDVREDTLNLDERLVEEAVTPRTRALLPVHYAGVACRMEELAAIARSHGLALVEDAAQGISATWRGQSLGTIGDLGCLSFHETKNLICGEGGALLVNRAAWVHRAEVVQEKGTNRSAFLRGEIDRYTWVDLGSSYLTSEIAAAFLWGQLGHAQEILRRRLATWEAYHERLADHEAAGRLRRPVVPAECSHNAHMYYLLLDDRDRRDRFIQTLVEQDIQALFHFVPLHSSVAGLRFGRAAGALPVTDRVAATLVRLPLWVGMGEAEVERVCDVVDRALGARRRPPCAGRQLARRSAPVVSGRVAHGVRAPS